MDGLRIAFCEVLLQRLRRRDRSAGLIPTRRKARSAAPAPNDLIEIGHGALLERGGARLLSKHLQLSRRNDGSLPRDIGRIIECHEIGPNEVRGAPATGEVGEGIVCPTRALTFRQSSRR